jgi:4,5-DOPA dioxygenase extradiol
MSTMPAAFVGHGSPMNALETNRYTEAWAAFGRQVPRPRAILAVSAHWFINASAVTAMEAPPTIHDFFGFPEALFSLRYAAPGDVELAARVADVVQPTWVGMDRDSWGLDHGTWSVLVHAFPAADIPVVQLSIDASKPLDYHVALGTALAPLREEGILILGSGNVVHNLPGIVPSMGETGYDWAHRFDDAARELMTSAPDKIATLGDHRDYRHAVPTPDHFLPLLYVAGLAAAAGDTADVMIDGYAYGTLSMTGYTVG